LDPERTAPRAMGRGSIKGVQADADRGLSSTAMPLADAKIC
jgi:hypothetical protein